MTIMIRATGRFISVAGTLLQRTDPPLSEHDWRRAPNEAHRTAFIAPDDLNRVALP
mgnify:CR=1 FL=1